MYYYNVLLYIQNVLLIKVNLVLKINLYIIKYRSYYLIFFHIFLILLIKLSLTIDILEKNYGSRDIRSEAINISIYKAYKCLNAYQNVELKVTFYYKL